MTLESGDQAHQRKASSVRVRLPRIWGLLHPYRWHVVATVTAAPAMWQVADTSDPSSTGAATSGGPLNIQLRRCRALPNRSRHSPSSRTRARRRRVRRSRVQACVQDTLQASRHRSARQRSCAHTRLISSRAAFAKVPSAKKRFIKTKCCARR